MNEKQPLITVLGQYIKGKEPVLVQCNKCGHQWSPVPNSLLSGEGCPECGKIIKANKRRKTQEQYETELYNINPDLEVISEYTGTNAPITIRCKVCGYEWTKTARKVLENPIHKDMKKKHGMI